MNAECVRGIWRIGESKRGVIKYIMAVYRRRVVGIYHVTRVPCGIGTEFARGLKDFPLFPEDERKVHRWLAQYSSVEEARQELSPSDFDIFLQRLRSPGQAADEALALAKHRVYFSVDDNVPMKVVFSHHFPKLEIKEDIDGKGKNADHVIYVPGQRSPFCYASVSDKKVYMFNFGKKRLKKWYPYDVQTPGERARAYGREHKIDMKFRLIEKDATVYEPMDMSRSYRVWFHQESYQYRNNAKEYRLTYFGEEKDYTVHGGIGGALIKEMSPPPRFRYVRGDCGSLRVKIERD